MAEDLFYSLLLVSLALILAAAVVALSCEKRQALIALLVFIFAFGVMSVGANMEMREDDRQEVEGRDDG